MKRRTPWVSRRQRRNHRPARERRPHYLFTRPEDPGEESGFGKERAARPFPALLDLHLRGDNNGAGSQDERGRHYKFTTLTALDSHYFPSATSLSLHPGSCKGSNRGGALKPPTAGTLISITTKTKNGGNLLYQFTADDGCQQDVVWIPINFWISRHPGERIILIGDMNGSIPGGVNNYILWKRT